MLAGVAVPARVRAGRAEQNFRRFESDNGGGHGARLIFLSRAFLLHFATGQATNNCVSRDGPSRLLSFLPELRVLFARIRPHGALTALNVGLSRLVPLPSCDNSFPIPWNDPTDPTLFFSKSQSLERASKEGLARC